MPLTAGAHLGPYEILARIGAGGMGEVYRARDTKLNRDVALKVLPDAFTADPDRLSRFKREAHVLASLNHPNIAAIYGLEESDSVRALVLELVDGPTLADRIAQGAMPIDEALPIAKQIAEALEAAHEQGIVHRDLKPANINLRQDGTVKVLDFGLAKAIEPVSAATANVTATPTITTPAMTQMGVILGTAAYMSPEQAKGRAADKRSDVWAFGCVLYEMLAGKRPFEGEDVSDTLAAVLRAEPDWDALPNDLAPSIGLLVRRSLEKDRRKRLGDVSTIRFLLDEPALGGVNADNRVGSAANARVAGSMRAWKGAVAMAAIAVALTAGGFAAWSARPRPAAPIVTRFSVPLGEGQQFTAGTDQFLALSPDGTRIVYVASRRLYVRSMSDLEPQPVRGSEGNPRRPMFSPDGSSIAYYSQDDRTLKRIAVSGGVPVTIATVENRTQMLGNTWNGDDIYLGSELGVFRVPAVGGKIEAVVRIEAGEYADAPQLLPDGDHLLFTLAKGTTQDRWQKAQIVAQALRTGERKVLVNGGSDGRFIRTGHLVYQLGGVLFAQRFDPKTIQVFGAAVPVVEGVRLGLNPGLNTGAAQFSVSDNGSMVYVAGPVASGAASNTLGWLDRKGAVEQLKLQAGPYSNPRIAPDGKQIAFATDDGRDATVWVHDLSGRSAARRLTMGGRNRYPAWSADGQRIAFQSDRDGDAAIFWQRADGSGTAERLTKPEKDTVHVPESFSPDGKQLLFGATKGGEVSLMVLSLADGKTAPFGDVRSVHPINATFSPDGKWVAYTQRGASTIAQIYVQTVPPTGQPYQVTKGDIANAHHPFWSRDGRELYYIPGATQYAVIGITTRPTFAFTDPMPLSRGPVGFIEGGPSQTRQNDAAPDGRVIAVLPARPTQSPEQTGGLVPPQIQVVLNWQEELKQRVPTR